MYLVLYTDDNGLICTFSSSTLEVAKLFIETESNDYDRNNMRLLQDVETQKESPDYKELYQQIYNDFVKPKSNNKEQFSFTAKIEE